MATIRRFEDIIAWQKARVLTRLVYTVSREGAFAKDFALRDQIRRAAISIMLNIAEGYARRTDKDFARFLNTAHGSAAEIQSALYVAVDQEYLGEQNFREIYDLADECSRLVQSFSQYLTKGDAGSNT